MSDAITGQGADLISIGDIAGILAVSKSTAARIAANEEGFPKPFVLNSTTKRYSRGAVIAWLASKQEQ